MCVASCAKILLVQFYLFTRLVCIAHDPPKVPLQGVAIWEKDMGQFPRKLPHGYIIKCYKNASRVNRYNFPTVNAIDFLFSTLHTTPFHYGKTYFGALH